MLQPDLEAALRESLPVHTVDALEGFPAKNYSEFLDSERHGRIEVLAKYDHEAIAVLGTRVDRAVHNLLAWSPFIIMAADVVAAFVFRSFFTLLGVPLAFLGMVLSVPGFMRSLGLWLNRALVMFAAYLLYEGRWTSASLVASYLLPNLLAHAARHYCRVIFLKLIDGSELALVWLFLRGSIVPVRAGTSGPPTD